jgi:hypothetical protein
VKFVIDPYARLVIGDIGSPRVYMAMTGRIIIRVQVCHTPLLTI